MANYFINKNDLMLTFVKTDDKHVKLIYYDGVWTRYKIHDNGMVSSYMKNFNGKILSLSTDSCGYKQVALSIKKKSIKFLIHRLVGGAFIPNPSNKPEVNHKDGKKEHNYISNLEWSARKENINHGFDNDLFHKKFSKETNDMVIFLLKENKLTFAEISEITGYNKDILKKIVNGTYKVKYFQKIGPIHEYTINNRLLSSQDELNRIRTLLEYGYKMTEISEITGIPYGRIKYINNKIKKEGEYMSNHRSTYQQQETVSIKRDKMIDLASDTEYSKKDYKVLLLLLSQLDGYTVPIKVSQNHKDPLNFKILDIEKMADTLSMSKKEVKKSIEKLHDDGILEKGSNDTIKNGYRFTF